MKIEYREGDVLASDVYVVAHGCNNMGIMGSGIAKQIKAQYPAAFDRYHKLYLEDNIKLGSVHFVKVNELRMIGNFITQPLVALNDVEIRYASYDAIAECMVRANALLVKNNITEFAMPLIGAGLGGANWNIIESIIENTCHDVKPIVYKL